MTTEAKLGRVLIVDDDLALRNLFADILRGEGYRVTEVIEGNEAIKELERDDDPIGVALIDLKAPALGMGGMELSERMDMDPRWSGIPKAQMSGMPDPSWKGPTLLKPFDLIDLTETVAEMFRSSRPQ